MLQFAELRTLVLYLDVEILNFNFLDIYIDREYVVFAHV